MDVGRERAGGRGKDRGGARHINADAGGGRPAREETGRGVTAASDHRGTLPQPGSLGHGHGQSTDDRGGLHDPRQPVHFDAKGGAQCGIPAAGGRVGESREVKITRVDERVLGGQPAQSHRRVGARLDEGSDPRVVGRLFLFPPQNFRAVVEAGGIAGGPQYGVARVALQPLDLTGAPGVEPRVIGGDRATVGADANDAGHLPGHCNRGDVGGPGLVHTAANQAAG